MYCLINCRTTTKTLPSNQDFKSSSQVPPEVSSLNSNQTQDYSIDFPTTQSPSFPFTSYPPQDYSTTTDFSTTQFPTFPARTDKSLETDTRSSFASYPPQDYSTTTDFPTTQSPSFPLNTDQSSKDFPSQFSTDFGLPSTSSFTSYPPQDYSTTQFPTFPGRTGQSLETNTLSEVHNTVFTEIPPSGIMILDPIF